VSGFQCDEYKSTKNELPREACSQETTKEGKKLLDPGTRWGQKTRIGSRGKEAGGAAVTELFKVLHLVQCVRVILEEICAMNICWQISTHHRWSSQTETGRTLGASGPYLITTKKHIHKIMA